MIKRNTKTEWSEFYFGKKYAKLTDSQKDKVDQTMQNIKRADQKDKKIVIKGTEYLITKTTQGAKGIHVFKLPQHHSEGRYDNIAEFKEYLSRRKNR